MWRPVSLARTRCQRLGRRTFVGPAATALLVALTASTIEAQTVADRLVWGPSGRYGQVSPLVGRWAALGAIDLALNAPTDQHTVFVTGGGTALADAVALAGSNGTLIEVIDSATYTPIVFRNTSRVYIRARAGQSPKIASDASLPTAAGGGNSNAIVFEGENVDIGIQGFTFLVRQYGNAENPRRPDKIGAIRYSSLAGGEGTRLQGVLIQDCLFQPFDRTLGAVAAIQFVNGGSIATHRDVGIRRVTFDSTGSVEAAIDDLAAVTLTDFENVLISNVHVRRTSTQTSQSELRGFRTNVRAGVIEYAYCEDLGNALGQANECIKISGTAGHLDNLDVVASHVASLSGNRAFAASRPGSSLAVRHSVIVTNSAERILEVGAPTATLTLRDSILVQLSGAATLLTALGGGTFTSHYNLFNWLGPLGFSPDVTDRYPGSPTCDAICSPLLVNPLASDFRLGPGSPARGVASDGTDLGILTYAMSPASQAFGTSGGSGIVSVTAAGNWSGSAGATWISPSTFGPFSGNGSISYLVAPNTSSLPRQTTITLAGMPFVVTQSGVACNFTRAPASHAVSAAGGSVSVSVSAAATDCAWTATSSLPWVTVTAGGTNTGAGTAVFAVAPNASSIGRSGSIDVAGTPVSITQTGLACNFSLSSTGAALPAEGATGLSLGLTADVNDCGWVASSTASWLTLQAPTSGQGSATLTYSVAPNPNASLRSAQISVGGRTFTVSQTGVSCTYTLGASSAFVASTGATGRTVSLSTNAPDCNWNTAASNTWISVTSATFQTGSGTITYSVAPNASSQMRTGTLLAGGETFRIDQAGTTCAFTLSSQQTASPLDANGGAGSVGVSATATDCTWTASTAATWLSITGGMTGVGSGPVSFSVAPNPSSLARSAIIMAAGQAYTVHQSGQACGLAISPTGQSVVHDGASGSFSVDVAIGDCGWAAVSDAEWLVVESGASGTGPGPVGFSAVPNPNSAPRTGRISVGGKTFTVTQAGRACAYTLPSPSGEVGPAAGSSSVAVVATAPDCTWVSTSPVSWLSLTGGTSRTGSTSATFSVTANGSSQPRTALMTVAGHAYSLVQQGVTCTYALSASSTSVVVGGGSRSILLTCAANDCPWTVTSNAPWITVTSSAAGQGNSTVSIAVGSNPSSNARTGTVTIAGLTYTVTQAAAPCTYTVSTKTVAAQAAGGRSTVALTTSPADCAWTASSAAAWIVPAATTGTGAATLELDVAPTVSSKSRTANVAVQGQTIAVTQSGLACAYTLSPTSASFTDIAGIQSVDVESNAADCAWTSTNGGLAWIAITSGASGTGNRTVTFTVRANTTTQRRTGTMFVAGVPFNVTQSGAPCSATVSTTSATASATASTGKITVTAASVECEWSAVSNAPWLTITAGAASTGSGSVTYGWTANPSSRPRTGTLTVSGQTVTVTQAGVPCVASVTPASATLPALGGPGSAALTLAPSDCTWSATSNASWLTVTSPTSGTGPTEVTFSAAPNQDTRNRSATLTVGGKSFTVTQSAMGGTANPFRRYLAEGASSEMFRTRIALLNPGGTQTTATLRFQKDDGSVVTTSLPVRGSARATVDVDSVLGPAPVSFSTEVESPAPLVVDRTMTWSTGGRYGSHAENSLLWPSETWYLAEGSTAGFFDLFYLIQNPNADEARVNITFLRPGGQPPIAREYTVAPRSRFTLWVDGIPGLESTDVSGVIVANRGIIVERAMYLTRPGGPFFAAGHASAGVTAPDISWFLAEGATGPFFDLYVLIANPSEETAHVTARFLLVDGTVIDRHYDVAPLSRFTVWVDQEDPLLADAAVSTIVTSTNGVPIIVERTMWWPGNWTTWHEAHNSPGATETGTRWALAEGEVGGPDNADTYILIANTSNTQGTARVTIYFESGSPVSQNVALPPRSRTNVHVRTMFPQAVGKRFGAIIESLGAPAAEIVVERAMYTDALGIHWMAGTNALATKLK